MISGAALSVSSARHTVKNEDKEHQIFMLLLHKRLEEQEQTREHFVQENGEDEEEKSTMKSDQYPTISGLINTWEELCKGICDQHDFLDRKLLAESMERQNLERSLA